MISSRIGSHGHYCDNQSCVELSENPMFHDKSKHIEPKYHFIRDKIQKGTVKLQFIPKDQQIVDILTKPLAKGKLKHSETNLDWCKIPSSLRGSVESID